MSDDEPALHDARLTFVGGTLTVNELQQIFRTIPFELDLVDANDHFAWFSDQAHRNHVRRTDQIGKTLAEIHPAQILPAIKSVIGAFKAGTKESVTLPSTQNGHRIMTTYYALRDETGKYLGTLECTANVDQIIGMFENGAFDAITSASETPHHHVDYDATSGASEKPKMPEIPKKSEGLDATSGASAK